MSRQHAIPTIRRRADGGAEFAVPYEPAWVARVKALVPTDNREWNPAAKTWTIWPPHVEAVLALTMAIFRHIDDVGAAAPAPAVDAWRVLHLRETAPPEVIESAFRTLAKLVHPDRGGSHEQMLALTAARDALRELVPSS
jgi:hypothetical protein